MFSILLSHLFFLQKLRIKFLAKRNKGKRLREETLPKENEENSLGKRVKTETTSKDIKSTETENTDDARGDDSNDNKKEPNATGNGDEIKIEAKIEDDTNEEEDPEEEDPEEEPQEDEEMPQASPHPDSAEEASVYILPFCLLVFCVYIPKSKRRNRINPTVDLYCRGQKGFELRALLL